MSFQRVVSLRAPNALRAGTNAAKHVTITATQTTNCRFVPVIPSVPAMSAHAHPGFGSDGARRSRRLVSCVLRGQPCPLRYHQKNQSHAAVTTSIHGIEGDVRKFRSTAMLGGIAPILTTNSAIRIPRTIAGRRFQKRLNMEAKVGRIEVAQQTNPTGFDGTLIRHVATRKYP